MLEKSFEFSGSQIVGGDESARLGVSTTCELPYEKVVAEVSEIEGSQSHTPRSIQPITVLKTLQELARGSKYVHEPQAWAVGFKARTFFVEHIGNDNVIANRLDVEGYVIARQVVIRESIFCRVAGVCGGCSPVFVAVWVIFQLK